MARIKELTINGSCISLYNVKKDKTRGPLFARKLVPIDFIELWYKVVNGEFDNELWHDLRDKEKDFFAQVVEATHTQNKHFNIALAKYTKDLLDRLSLIEGEIHAGNLSRSLVNEFKSILDRLAETRQMPPNQVNRLKARIERTFEAQQAK